MGKATALAVSKLQQQVLIHDYDNKRSLCRLDEIEQSCDTIFLCLPTPPSEDGFDTAALELVASKLGEGRGTLVIRSTVLPGTTNRIFRQWRGALVYMPEFLREKHMEEDALKPSRIIVGHNGVVPDMVSYLASNMAEKVFYASIEEAEAAKLFSNYFLSTRISWFNEARKTLQKKGINAENVFRCMAADERIGEYGSKDVGTFGGNCLPKDLHALERWAGGSHFLTATKEVNEGMKA